MKLKKTLLLIAALTGSATFAFAQNIPAGFGDGFGDGFGFGDGNNGGGGGDATGDRKAFGQGGLPEFLAKYDLDGNGTLDEEERQAAKEDRRQRARDKRDSWDTDGDGTLSDKEREAARDELRAKIEARRDARFDEADTDGNGELSLEEFSAVGPLSRLAEFRPALIERLFNYLDTDGNGGISKEEFTSNLRHRRPHRRGEGESADPIPPRPDPRG